jgi:hypothetical protein
MVTWKFLTNHAQVLPCIAHEPLAAWCAAVCLIMHVDAGNSLPVLICKYRR